MCEVRQEGAPASESSMDSPDVHYHDKEDHELLLGSQRMEDSSCLHWASTQSKRLQRRRKIRQTTIMSLAAVGYTAIVAFIAAVFVLRVYPGTHGHLAGQDEYPALVDCGHNATTAEAAGCKFDLLMVGWTQPECIDSYVLDDAYSNESPLSPWGAGLANWADNWFVDEEFTMKLPSDPKVLGFIDGIWTHFYYHKIHCGYVWRHLSHALARKLAGEKHVFVYRYALQYEHTVHCNWMVLEHQKSLMDKTFITINGVNKCVELKLDLNGKPYTGYLAGDEEEGKSSVS